MLSRAVYPVRFTEKTGSNHERGAGLSGEKRKQPFVVKVDEIEVLVTGTLFSGAYSRN